MDKDPWGKLYKMVMQKLNGPPLHTLQMESSAIRVITDRLFP